MARRRDKEEDRYHRRRRSRKAARSREYTDNAKKTATKPGSYALELHHQVRRWEEGGGIFRTVIAELVYFTILLPFAYLHDLFLDIINFNWGRALKDFTKGAGYTALLLVIIFMGLPWFIGQMNVAYGYGWHTDAINSVIGFAEDLPNQTAEAADSLKTAAATPVYKLECQQQVLQQTTDNPSKDIRNCVRKKQGKEPIEEKDDKPPEWQLRGTTSFLDITLRHEIVENNPGLRNRCGTFCAVVEAQLRNAGNLEAADIGLTDLYLTVSWQNNMNVPIYLNPSAVGDGPDPSIEPRRIRTTDLTTDSNKFYKLDHFIDGTTRYGSFLNPTNDLPSTEWTLRPQETHTATFLVNLSSYMTYIRDTVRENAEAKVKEIQQEIEESDSLTSITDYCEAHYGTPPSVYDGSALPYPTVTSNGEPSDNQESFPSLAEQNTDPGICTNDLNSIINSTAKPLFNQKNNIKVSVKANYTSTTSSVFNIHTTNVEYWNSLSIDQREQFIGQNCDTLGKGNIEKQHSFLDRQPSTAVGIMLYTQCDINYWPEGSADDPSLREQLNTKTVNLQAKGDESKITNFRITDLRNTDSLCDSSIGDDETLPANVYTENKWFTKDENGWTSPVTSCRFTVPPVSETDESDILNYEIRADYEAQTSEDQSLEFR